MNNYFEKQLINCKNTHITIEIKHIISKNIQNKRPLLADLIQKGKTLKSYIKKFDLKQKYIKQSIIQLEI